MSDFLTKTECELNTKLITRDIKNLNEAVDKVVDKVEKLSVKVERQDVTMTKLEKIVDKLSDSVDKFADALARVDKETAVNTTNITWDWKIILAGGAVMMFLLTTIGTIITNAL